MWPSIHKKSAAPQGSPMMEAVWKLRTTLSLQAALRETERQQLQVLTVASAGDGEGKSATAVNLALEYARCNKRVVLLDANLRKPAVHRIFAMSNRIGLSDLAEGRYDDAEMIRSSGNPQLDFVTAGPAVIPPIELLASSRMSSFIDRLRRDYDRIIIDTPSLLAWTDGQIAASISDGVLLVIRSGQTKLDDAAKAKTLLEQVKANIVGVVMNGA